MAKRSQSSPPSTETNALPAGDDPYRIVAKYSNYAGAVGFIPLPGLDLVAFGGLQLRMIAELCAHYDVPFNTQVGKSVLAVMVGTYAPARLAMSFIPVLGFMTGPSLGYSVTWSIGRIFMKHFESGGTLQTFDPQASSAELQQQLQRAGHAVEA